MGVAKSFVITFLSIMILAWLFPAFSYANIPTLLIFSIVLTVLQKIVEPVMKILFLPINIITLGLFSWIVDGIILWLAILVVPGFHIDPFILFGIHLNEFFSIVFAAFAIGIVQSIIELIL